MADYYCDHGAYDMGANRLGLTPPTWGAPQDGDGLRKDASPSSATASVTFTTVPTSGLFYFGGAFIPATGVFNAASVDAAANALAANINTSTTALSSYTSPVGAQVRNFYYARGPSGGAPAGTCQVMTRIGSALLNTAADSNMYIGTTFNGDPVVTDFVGGVSGCWGYLINPFAIGANSSIPAMTYGALLHQAYVGSVVALSEADTIHVRTGGGASKLIEFTGAAGTTITPNLISKRVLFDSNLVWTGDAPDGKVHLKLTYGSGNGVLALQLTRATQFNSYECRRRGGWEIEARNIPTGGAVHLSHVSGSGQHGIAMSGVRFTDAMSVAGVFLPFSGKGNPGSEIVADYHQCDLVTLTPRPLLGAGTGVISSPAGSPVVNTRFVGCTFDFNTSGVADPGPVLDILLGGSAQMSLIGCEFKGYAGGYRVAGSYGSSSGARLRILVDNCKGLKFPDSYFGLPTPLRIMWAEDRQFVHSAILDQDNPGFRMENSRGVCEWVPNDPTPFPTAGAIMSITGDPWALRLLWVASVPLSNAWPFVAAPLRSLNPHATAPRTIGLRLLLPSAVNTGVTMTVMYQDDTGAPRSEETNLLQGDSTAWTNADLYAGFAARKLQVLTSYPVKQGCEIQVLLQLDAAPPYGPVLQVYYNPEPDVA